MANSTKFPSGMKAVGDALHAMGLGFGMYSSAGVYTCGQYGEYFPLSVFVVDEEADICGFCSGISGP